VNLEPCSHHGRTPPCVDAIIEELRSTTVAERSGRAQDEGRGMELLRKDGYM